MKKFVPFFIILAMLFTGAAKRPPAPADQKSQGPAAAAPKTEKRPQNSETIGFTCADGKTFVVPTIEMLTEQEAKGVLRVMRNEVFNPTVKLNPCDFVPISISRFFRGNVNDKNPAAQPKPPVPVETPKPAEANVTPAAAPTATPAPETKEK